jgi:hypothetical protein
MTKVLHTYYGPDGEQANSLPPTGKKSRRMVTNNRYNVQDFIVYLVENAQEQSNYYPVDRCFLEPMIDQILAYQSIDIIYYTIELTGSLFASQFFLCLPELWEEVSFDELLGVCEKFEKSTSFDTIIKFTYKYLEIDILNASFFDVVRKKSPAILEDIRLYLQLQYNVLIKTDWETEEYLKDEELGIDYDRWLYLKQRFLLDSRIRPAITEIEEFKRYIDLLIEEI